MTKSLKAILFTVVGSIALDAFAAQIEFTGNLVFVLDPQTGSLAGTAPGAEISGSITYGDSSLDAQFISPGSEEASYTFTQSTFGSIINISGQSFSANGQVRMDIVDNAIQSNTAEFIFDGLFGQSDEFNGGQTYDDWGVSSWPTAATITPGGGGAGDQDYYLGGGVFIAIGVRSFDDTLYANTDYVPLPETLGSPAYGQFRLVQRDIDGTLLFDATGNLTSLTGTHPVSNIPLPLPLFAFIPCLLGLVRFTANGQRRRI